MKRVNLQGLCSMPSPASETPGISVQEATKILLKWTGTTVQICIVTYLSKTTCLFRRIDCPCLGCWLFAGSPQSRCMSLKTPRSLLKGCLVFDQSPILSVPEKNKDRFRDDVGQILFTKIYVLVWGRRNTAGFFQKLLWEDSEPRQKDTMLQIVLGESFSFLDHCFMSHKDQSLWSSGRLSAFPFVIQESRLLLVTVDAYYGRRKCRGLSMTSKRGAKWADMVVMGYIWYPDNS